MSNQEPTNTSLDKIVTIVDICTPERDQRQERNSSRLQNRAKNDSIPVDQGLEKSQSMEGEIIDQKSDKIVGQESEEVLVVKVPSIENEVSASSSNLTSISAERNTGHFKVEKEGEELLLNVNEWDKMKTLDDSEDSICEVPVPPKPRPPIIDLEYSGSPSSSDTDIDAEKFNWSQTMAEIKARKQKTRGRGKRVDKTKRCNLFSDSDDSVDQSEEVDWEAVARSQINIDKPTASSSRDLGASKIAEKLGTDVELRDNTCQIMENSYLVDEMCENQIRGSKRKSVTDYSNVTKKTSGGLSETSLVVERKLDENERQNAENNEKEKSQGNDQNLVADDALLVSVELDRSLLDLVGSRASQISTRTSDDNKRPVSDSENKSKHENSPKKFKGSNDSAKAGLRSSKSLEKNKENIHKDRNRAADYFWKNITFDIHPSQSKKPRAPWAILYENLHGCQQTIPTHQPESQCGNCNHAGQHVAECPEIRKDPSCYMCGAIAYRELRCYDKKSLGSTENQEGYKQVCRGCYEKWYHRCQVYGHVENNCPDPSLGYHSAASHKDVNTQPNVEDVRKPNPPIRCSEFSEHGDKSTSVDCPAEVRDRNETETEAVNTETDGGVTHKSLPSNEERKIESNADKITKGNSKADEFLHNISEAVDKNVEKAVKQLEKERESRVEEIHKSSKPLWKICKALKSKEFILEFKSELLDDKLSQAADFGEYTFFLIAKNVVQQRQYDGLSDSLSREFLLNLTSQFPIKLGIIRCRKGIIAVSIGSARDLHKPIQLTITDWLTRLTYERERFLKLNLPTAKEDLVKLLTEKLDQLKQDPNDPVPLYAKIRAMRRDMKVLKSQSRGKARKIMEPGWRSEEHIRMAEELSNADHKLNSILLGQGTTKASRESLIFLKDALWNMRRPSSPNYISAAAYLELVHHYNIIFSAYTAGSQDSMVFEYWKKHRPQELNGAPLWSTPNSFPTYENFMKHINELSRSTNSDPLMTKAGQEIIPQTPSSPNSDRVETQSVIPGENSDNMNRNLHPNLSPPQIQSPDGSDKLEDNCNNSKSDFGDNSKSQKDGGVVQSIGEQDTCITLDSPEVQIDYANVKKDFITVESVRKLEGLSTDIRTLRNCSNEKVKTGSANSFGTDLAQISPCLGTNICPVSLPPSTTTSQHVFSPQREAESFQSIVHKNISDVRSKDEIEMRNRKNLIGPSILGLHDLTVTRSDRNTGKIAKRCRIDSGKKLKKKKNRKASTLPLYLQKRAAENTVRYLNSGVPCIIQAAEEIKEKIKKEDLTLQCVAKFEKLIEVKLEKTEHLL